MIRTKILLADQIDVDTDQFLFDQSKDKKDRLFYPGTLLAQSRTQQTKMWVKNYGYTCMIVILFQFVQVEGQQKRFEKGFGGVIALFRKK